MTDKKRITLRIFDKDYALLVEDEEIAADLCKYVNQIINDTKDDLAGKSKETIAIISALNIAYDLFLEKNKFREFSIRSIDKIKKIKLAVNESDVSSITS